ncbi:uncharacterized protein ChaoS9_095 [Halobacterium phage ChaoS9]|uniref:Uncharacterized protein n=1 Tax=Halobacterium phage ChaoS9 TaxID=2847105 RepID=A0A481VAR8_9CAUD|nr:uncharacterized protein KMC41_gp20 [Halobacterium phage ChaoS9]QBI90026.1 uncharacterized protein ChaoS9_095 [Halobacterium phage ChaoS9]
MKIHEKTGKPIEEIAQWPWRKRLFYAQCYDAVEPDQQQAQRQLNLDVPGSTPPGVTPGVAQRDTVITTN